MDDKRCYLVVGPESAGNRLAASLLVAAGCKGRASTDQQWSDTLPKRTSPAVVIRSFPHGGEWPRLSDLIRSLRIRKYRVIVVVTVREPGALAASQVARGHCEQGAADARICRAYRSIFNDLWQSDDFVLLPYEALALNPQGAANAILERLGLPRADVSTVLVDHEERTITNENGKYYAVDLG